MLYKNELSTKKGFTIVTRIKQYLSQDFKMYLKKVRFFGFTHFCPICESYIISFKEHGLILRPNARCPVCGSLERHRLVWMFFQKYTNLFGSQKKKMLHVAPEPFFSHKLRRLSSLQYLSADLYDSSAMIRMSVSDIQFVDNTFDVIYCSHVLEHVLDDRRAIREFYRILKKGGWAVLQVPITTERTFEDSSIIDPVERTRLFGQPDHVRRYGPDYEQRLIDGGFKVQRFNAIDVVNESNFERMGIIQNENNFLLYKTVSCRLALKV